VAPKDSQLSSRSKIDKKDTLGEKERSFKKSARVGTGVSD
jgi:hypothetical protein